MKTLLNELNISTREIDESESGLVFYTTSKISAKESMT